ncbi:MAG: MOSC domain-containing protein, partial [Verrucomicrobiota bacterium]
MSLIGTVESLWRYPVKSMRGEELDEIFAGFAGVYGDRVFAFTNSASAGFPFFTGRDKREMIRYRPRFRHPDKAAAPINLTEAEKLGSGVTPLYASPNDFMLEVELPSGECMAIDDPELVGILCDGVEGKHELKLLRSERALTDCRPVSIFSLQTARRLSEETGLALDQRRFRANIYLDLISAEGFAEDEFVGRSLRLGSKVVVSILQRDGRCMMITLDPETAEKSPAVLKQVAQAHEGMAGVYGAVLVEGLVRKGDPVELLD